mgnify:CR=1 FL=1
MGRKCRRKLGNGNKLIVETLENILMMPFYVFKYAFSLAFWFFVITYIISTDWYDRVSMKIREKINGE